MYISTTLKMLCWKLQGHYYILLRSMQTTKLRHWYLALFKEIPNPLRFDNLSTIRCSNIYFDLSLQNNPSESFKPIYTKERVQNSITHEHPSLTNKQNEKDGGMSDKMIGSWIINDKMMENATNYKFNKHKLTKQKL